MSKFQLGCLELYCSINREDPDETGTVYPRNPQQAVVEAQLKPQCTHNRPKTQPRVPQREIEAQLKSHEKVSLETRPRAGTVIKVTIPFYLRKQYGAWR